MFYFFSKILFFDFSAGTWPFLITLLTKCVALEISGSKKRPPKLVLAKTLRTAIQCAEDPKFGGQQEYSKFGYTVKTGNNIWKLNLIFFYMCYNKKTKIAFQVSFV